MENPTIDTKLYDLVGQEAKNYFEELKKEGNIVPPLKAEELPALTTLRLFYNEAYYCVHSGFGLASMMLITTTAELITREIYATTINKNKADTLDWFDVLKELEADFSRKKLPKEAHAARLAEWIREAGKRNKFHHADIKGILKDVKQPALKINLNTGITIPEDLDANMPMLKHFEASYVENVSKTLSPMFLAALNDIIRVFYPLLPKSL